MSEPFRCKYCGSSNALGGTLLCDGCYEISSRLYRIPAERLALMIVQETSEDFVREIIEELRITISELGSVHPRSDAV